MFMAKCGLDAEATGRDVSFCRNAIEQYEPFIVENTLTDPRCMLNPPVTGSPGIGSYAGMPPSATEGYNVGTLCAIDTVPRYFRLVRSAYCAASHRWS